MKALVCIALLMGLVGCKSTSKLDVVQNFDQSRYLGVWYEVARYPHRFENGLSAVSATYSLNKDGTINVLNRGFNEENGDWENIEGTAKLKGSKTEGWLKVSFFKPFYASYKIIHLDADYTQAIVTGPTYSYFWILAREPVLPAAELKHLIDKAREFGFDPDNLILVDQTRNR